ncbi:uncharacterized protein Z518_07646 [Rhinocladiella mackenziei CBS 650.93]|uniref:Rhinocladiella mackenziei CBS 650.93 unplaced genomic scaffold supercont1.5, whole genome shotgun sequence n=1 Tax=Rhinocladiella mackenziei CBS 650.93 TaxID=1442369 RepID=A0A0D2H0X6_9EURO|nr:uncharacterized protein Z518_07646 [Rhinocladiella mackenziei CBS 650.93]KIX04093.1 hypothetical protein Z518_07646 [Rhinocladiella mackenziei CBS 650.93]
MQLTAVVAASALLLVAAADLGSAKSIMHLPNAIRRRNHLEDMRRDAGRLLRREPQGSNSLLSVAEPTAATNETIATACTNALEGLTSVENAAGMAACYNIMQYDPKQGAFEADLRLYQMFDATGKFQDVAVNDIMISVTYPASTMFQSLTKRRKRDVVERQSSMAEVQQYSLLGTFQSNLELSKLNETQIMSLMLPDVKLNAVDDSQEPITANITAADGAWFVVGEFQGEFKDTLVTSTAAAAAISAAVPFVLPGTSLGIFPTGLIVTCAWTLLFFLAYGLGTLGRIKYRDAYRKRKAAQAGRTGKRI